MLRMRIPQLINDMDEMNVQPKDDDDTMMGMKNTRMIQGMGKKVINADVDWKEYTKFYESVPRESLANTISGILLQTDKAVSEDLIKRYTDQSGRESFIKSATLQIMSTPEYQLC